MGRDKLMHTMDEGYCKLCDITAALEDMRSMVYGTPCNRAEYDADMSERVKEMLFMTLDFIYILGNASFECRSCFEQGGCGGDYDPFDLDDDNNPFDCCDDAEDYGEE